MSEISTIVCPNCGASTTNKHNCDYCGSLLVRFAERNIEIDASRYGKDAKPIAGMADEFKKNLSLQKLSGTENTIVTNIVSSDDALYQVVPSNTRLIGLQNSHQGLALSIPFQILSMDNDTAQAEKIRLQNFKNMDCFFLFEEKPMDDGKRYIIDFGSDYESAANVVSNIIREEDTTESFTYSTELLPNARLEVDEESGFLFAPKVSQAKQKKRKSIISSIIFIICIVVYIIIQISI